MPSREGAGPSLRWWEGPARFFFLAGLWLLLAGAEIGSWVIGLPAVLTATLLSLRLRSPVPWRWRPAGLARFIPYFLWHSLRGGLDVSRRALHPRLPLAPGLVRHRLRLPPGPSRVFLANTINLLPGTLSADLQGDRLTVHMLDATLVNIMELQRLEVRVADLFAVSLEGSEV